MAGDNYIVSALLEHRFWLQILGDHARFISHLLSATETQEIYRASQYINEFDQLLDESRRSLSHEELNLLSRRAAQSVSNLKSFKLYLLKRQIAGKIDLNMSPTFISHMVNELEEYERILGYLLNEHLPPSSHPLHYHCLWQSDAIGHAASLSGSIDMVETRFLDRNKNFQSDFESQYLKALEFSGYIRSSLQSFPALIRYNFEVEQHMRQFMEFLQEINQFVLENQLLGTLNPLFPDHMLREECYYLMKLASVSTTSSPPCDPTKPRISENA